MAHLRQIMLEELHRRNYAESTIDAYTGVALRQKLAAACDCSGKEEE